MYPQRYMIIDFSKAIIIIKHKKKDYNFDEKKAKQINFRDIKKCYKPPFEEEKAIYEA